MLHHGLPLLQSAHHSPTPIKQTDIRTAAQHPQSPEQGAIANLPFHPTAATLHNDPARNDPTLPNHTARLATHRSTTHRHREDPEDLDRLQGYAT
ncbi:Hypothetical predicted protein [Pelobates cultripes]|uniref:Uncharacterized protein n=1 Tax=Pelobates cultripes TaxID=61616 RepID=A0AAD1WFS4_PELCU|nr:Hypothetical predicted protein [Pelobates cultripes]